VPSRTRILAALRAAAPPAVSLPDLPAAGQRFDDPAAHFAKVLQNVGGRCERLPGMDAVKAAVAILPVVLQASKVASLVPEAHPGNLALAAIEDPHALADVDVALLRADFAVAENGAVWVPGLGLGRHQALPFITQHLVLVVEPLTVLHTMHEAYARLRFDGPGFGLFISGPSKTADIEQALVIGAHGARSTVVYLVG
jgi:L-lactate dehydrogenase complex protein LldG